MGFSQVRVMRAPQEMNNVCKQIISLFAHAIRVLSLILNVHVNFRQLAFFAFVSNPLLGRLMLLSPIEPHYAFVKENISFLCDYIYKRLQVSAVT